VGEGINKKLLLQNGWDRALTRNDFLQNGWERALTRNDLKTGDIEDSLY